LIRFAELCPETEDQIVKMIDLLNNHIRPQEQVSTKFIQHTLCVTKNLIDIFVYLFLMLFRFILFYSFYSFILFSFLIKKIVFYQFWCVCVVSIFRGGFAGPRKTGLERNVNPKTGLTVSVVNRKQGRFNSAQDGRFAYAA
jgi:hypothetical protein